MKFSEIRQAQWQELKPYLDTCLLPVTGLDGSEEPWQAGDNLERLRDLLDLIEVPYHGRVVTYPAYHYTDDEQIEASLSRICQRLKESGFRYVIIALLNAEPESWQNRQLDHCDYVLTEGTDGGEVKKKISEIWFST